MGPDGCDWIATLDGYEAFAIMPGGATTHTPGFAAYLR